MLKKWNRIGATVIDYSIIMILIKLTYTLLVVIFPTILVIKGGGNAIDLVFDFLKVLFSLMWSVFIAVFYNVFLTLKFKNTFGRLILKVNVLDENSGNKIIKPSKKQLIKRETFKWTLILSTFFIYAFYVLIGIILGKERFYYDKVANTKVEVWV